jgi:hypothetical protein
MKNLAVFITHAIIPPTHKSNALRTNQRPLHTNMGNPLLLRL